MKLNTLFVLFFLINISGCTTGMSNRIMPESHFVHPNSNVKVLGPVHVEMSGGWSLFVPPPIRTSADDEKIYQAALSQQQGADIIVDAVVSSKVTMYPTPYVSIFRVDHILEGFAAKKDVGVQELH